MLISDAILDGTKWIQFALVQCYCISPNVGRYFGLVTGPPLPPAMEAMQAMEAAAMEAAAATERFQRLFVCLFVCEQYSGKTP